MEYKKSTDEMNRRLTIWKLIRPVACFQLYNAWSFT